MSGLVTTADLPGGEEGLGRRLEALRREIAAAATRARRAPEDVELVVVTKYVETDVVRILHGLGVRDFGENRVQELDRKADALADLEGIRFHFLGHLQRNKVKRAVGLMSAFHALDSVRLLEELEERVAEHGGPAPATWVEVNVAGEEQKTGLPLEELPRLLRAVAGTRHVRAALRGLMTMAPYSERPEDARPVFRRLRELRDRGEADGLLPRGAGLSMGMSQDFPLAIEEGATVVRIGSRLYR